MTGGTDNHCAVGRPSPGINWQPAGEGPGRGEISTNKNTLYGDTSALNPGGIRLGSLCGNHEKWRREDMVTIVGFLDRAAQVAGHVNMELLTKKEGSQRTAKWESKAFGAAERITTKL